MDAQHTAKTVVAITIPFVTALPFDVWWLIFVPLGLTLGWLARAGRMVGDRRSWADIRRDMLVSFLIGGANGVIAALIIWRFDLTYLPGLAVAFVCAFGGVQSLDTGVLWGKRQVDKWTGNDRAMTREEFAQELGDNRARTQAALSEMQAQMKERMGEAGDGTE